MQRPLRCVFAYLFKHWSASEIQRIMVDRIPVSTIKVGSSMETVHENASECMFMAWDKLSSL